jgi:hypothetical protein
MAALLSQILIIQGQEEYIADGELTASAEEFRWLTNRARFDGAAENGLRGTNWPVHPSRPPMAPNAKLTLAANHHAVDMATHNSYTYDTVSGSAFFPWKDHQNNSRLDVLDRLDFVGYSSGLAAQMNAAAVSSSEEFFGLMWAETSPEVLMLNYAREFGYGFSPRVGSSLYSSYHAVKVAQASESFDFFTDTLYHDANQNNTYNAGEGIGGVQIWLTVNGVNYMVYDRSTKSG